MRKSATLAVVPFALVVAAAIAAADGERLAAALDVDDAADASAVRLGWSSLL